MSGAELGLIIGALAAFVTSIASLIGSRSNGAKVDMLQEEIKAERSEREKATAENALLREDLEVNRRDIISLGEHYSGMSKDVGILVLLVNKLYMDYNKDTGHKPDIDWSVLDRALTIQHKTSPLGPLEIK